MKTAYFRTGCAIFARWSCGVLLLAGVGCAQWKSSDSSDRGLAIFQKSDASKKSETARVTQISQAKSTGLVVEVQFVTVDSDKATPTELDSLWQWIDETQVDVGQRKTLLANGLRTGRVLDADRFRDQLQSLEHDEGVLDEFMQTASVGSNLKRPPSEHAMRMGRRYELPVGKPLFGELTTIVKIVVN